MSTLANSFSLLTKNLLAALVAFVVGTCFARAAVPGAPTLTVAGPLETQLTLSWSASSGASTYNVYRGNSSGSETQLATGVSGTTYEDSGLNNGQSFFYQVTAVNSSGESAKSGEKSGVTKAAAPSTFTATAGDSQVVLNWNASATATGYHIYRDTLGGPGGATSFTVNGGSTTSFTDTGLVNGTPYYYEITSINPSGENPLTLTYITATPQGTGSEAPAGAPGNLQARAGAGQVLLQWSPVSNATTYDVYRSTSAGTETAWHAGVAGLSYTDSSLTNGTTYYYKVRATSSGGSSALSSEASATPNLPGTPTILTTTTASGNVVLTWSAAGTSYAIYRGVTPGAETLLDSGLTSSTYTDAGLVNGTTYYYKVQGLNAGGTGPMSAEVSATPTGPAAQSWTQVINFGLQGEPVQSCTASIPDINRPVLFAYFMETVNGTSNSLGPNAQALVVKYNALILDFEGMAPPAYNFGSATSPVSLSTSDDSHPISIIDYRWPLLGAQRILAALAAAAAAIPTHPEIANTGIVIHGFSEGTDNSGMTLAQTVGSTPLVSRVLAVIAQSEIDEDHYNPLSVVDTVPYLLQATGVGGDASSQLNIPEGDFPFLTHDAFVRGLSTNQGAALTVFDNVGQAHGGVPDHPFIPIWLDSILCQRLPATLPVSVPVNLPSWRNTSAWVGTYDVTTSTSSLYSGNSGSAGVQLVNNAISSRNTYADPRPFTWLPSQNAAKAWLAYANNGTAASLVPQITSATTASVTSGSAFIYQITATNEAATYTATGTGGTALPAGLSFNSSTGIISGTPTATGTFPITITATNNNGTSSTSTLTLTIQAPLPTSADTPTLPQWALLVLLAALFLAGSRLPRKPIAS
jgi:fibronectin type 3 domain-containing protein